MELIASENIVSEAVMEAMGSVFTNKYAEGYPAKRYYGGCENCDTVETLAIDRACELFGAKLPPPINKRSPIFSNLEICELEMCFGTSTNG